MKGKRIYIKSDLAEPPRLLSGIPQTLKNQLVPAAFPISCAANGNHFLFQKIRGDGFNIFFNDYSISDDTEVDFFSENGPVGLHYILDGKFIFHAEGLGTLKLDAGRFGLVHTPSIFNTLKLSKNNHCSTLSIDLAPKLFEEQVNYFPFLESFSRQVRNKEAFIISDENCYSNLDMLQVIQQIKHCNLPNIIIKPYLSYKVRELVLLSILRISDSDGKPPFILQPSEKERIQSVMEQITKHPEKDFSINILARQSGLNTEKLKQGFKHLYGDTIFGVLAKQRMELAKILLSSTDKSITEIAYMTGFSDASSFVHSFKKHYGTPPSKSRGKH